MASKHQKPIYVIHYIYIYSDKGLSLYCDVCLSIFIGTCSFSMFKMKTSLCKNVMASRHEKPIDVIYTLLQGQLRGYLRAPYGGI